MTMTYTDTSTGEVMDGLPACDLNDPAQVEAHYGNYGFFEHFRKVVLSSCKEAERAKASISGEKITVDRADDLARVSETYVTFLTTALQGRIARERNVRESMAR